MLWIMVFFLAGLGALARLVLQDLGATTFGNWGVLVANILGSAAIGVLMAQPTWLITSLSPNMVRASAVGLLGAFTTFSSFSMEVTGALSGGQWLKAGGLVLAHNLLAVSACFLSYRMAWEVTR